MTGGRGARGPAAGSGAAGPARLSPSVPQAAAAAVGLPRGRGRLAGNSVMEVPWGAGGGEGPSARGRETSAGVSAEGDCFRGCMEVTFGQEPVGLSFLRGDFQALLRRAHLLAPPAASARTCLYNKGKKSILMFRLRVTYSSFNSWCRFSVVPYNSR